MHIDYAKVMRFALWFFREIVRLIEKGTPFELELFVGELESMRKRYLREKGKLKREQKSKQKGT